MRLIDTDTLKNALFKIHVHDGMDSEMLLYFDDVEKVIDTMPTIDAVPVVWCKDCKWWDRKPSTNGGLCYLGGRATGQYGFCADGLRREENATG